MFAGINGVFTGLKSGAFSISENDRQLYQGIIGEIENLILLFTGYPSISWIIRDAFINCNDFKCAEDYLSKTHIIADGYIILAGLEEDEGVIISRNRFNSAHIDRLDKDHWYLL